MMKPRIIHKDDAIIIIDKPAGMPSVSLKAGEKGTLASWIIENFPRQREIEKGEIEAGLVNRLDNDTSGLVVAARSNESFDDLRAQFDAGTIEKEYIALVLGNPPDEGNIGGPIAHHPRKKKKMVVCTSKAQSVELKARPAHTSFAVAKRYILDVKSGAGIEYSLLTVDISTGVRHQVRAHLASIGFPIAGDALYQSAKSRAMDRLNLKRHFLHAKRISFVHPDDGKRLEFFSPLPEDLDRALASLAPVCGN